MPKLYKLYYEQIIKCSLEDTWKFFSNPQNLQKITPEYMNFRILSDNLPDEIYQGLIIEYKVSPLLGIDFFWVTEITAVENHRYFIDEQRFGPYKFWHHTHLFQKINNEVTKIIDLVHYLPPYGLIGRLANSLLIDKKLKNIFTYRKKVISDLFLSE